MGAGREEVNEMEPTIMVRVWLMETSQPLIYQAKTTYTKGRLYCLHLPDDRAVKFPMCNIFRIEEEWGKHGYR